MNPVYRALVATVLAATLTTGAHAQQPLGRLSVIIQDQAGKPLQGATVQCVNWDDSGPRTEPLTPREQATSDAEGRAEFEGVTIGQAFVRVISGELGGWFRVQDRSEDVPLKIGVGHSTLVIVRDEAGKPIPDVVALADGCIPFGKTDADGKVTIHNHGIGYAPQLIFVKAGYGWVNIGLHFNPEKIIVTLKPGAILEGVTLGPDGKPVSGVDVRWNWEHGEQKAISNEMGEFRFPDIAAASRRGKLMAFTPNLQSPLRGEATVPTTTETVAKVTITLQAAPERAAQQTAARPGVTLHGKVVHQETGKPVVAKILLGRSDRFEFPQKAAVSDADGRFTLERVEGDWIWLCAAPLNPALYTVGGLVRLKVADAQSDEFTIKVADGCAMRGRVLTDDGKPVVQAQVMFQPMGAFYRAIWTDENGRFSIPSLDGVGVSYKLSVSDKLNRSGTLDVGPLAKGEVRDDLELKMPKEVVPAVLRGAVVDSEGKPVSNVNLSFIYQQRDKEPSLLSASSDDRGEFSVPIARSGAVKAQASRVTQLDPRRHESAECPVLEGGSFELAEGTDKEVRVVIKPESLRVLIFKVVDETGQPVKAEAHFVFGEYREESVQAKEDASFFAQRFPKDPYVLEVTAPQYQSRVLFRGTDFNEGDENLIVTLKKCPYAVGASVWEAVTGHPATKESVEATPLADIVRKRERKYFYNALPPRKPVPAPSASQAPAPPAPGPTQGGPPKPARDYSRVMRVVDGAGKPVTRILVEQTYIPDFDKLALLPPRGGSQQPKTSENGEYPIPEGQGCVVSAPGLARVGVSPWNLTPTEPRTIVLEPPCTLELVVSGADGRPAPDTSVSLLQAAWEGDTNVTYTTLLKTDAQGRAVFTDIAPGAHAFAVGAHKQNMQALTVTLKQKERRTVKVKLEDRQGSHNPLVLMQIWREERRPHPKYPATEDTEWIDSIHGLPKAAQKALAKEIRESMPIVLGDPRLSMVSSEETRYLLALAGVAGDEAVAKTLREMFPAIAQKTGPRRLLAIGADFQLVTALARIEGDGAVSFLEKAAGDDQLGASARTAAVCGLGQIHSAKSAEAFARLRDAAYGKPGAPARRETYTHAERIREAAVMTLYVIPGAGDAPAMSKADLPGGLNTTVDEDYQTGNLWMNNIHLRLNRVGSEWLVSSAEMGPVP